MRNGLIYSPTVLVTRALLLKSSGLILDDKGVDSDFYRYHILYSTVNHSLKTLLLLYGVQIDHG